jgi:hypothetical protein
METIPNFYKTTAGALSRLELQVYQTSSLQVLILLMQHQFFDNQFTNGLKTDVTKLSTGLENLSFSNRGFP